MQCGTQSSGAVRPANAGGRPAAPTAASAWACSAAQPLDLALPIRSEPQRPGAAEAAHRAEPQRERRVPRRHLARNLDHPADRVRIDVGSGERQMWPVVGTSREPDAERPGLLPHGEHGVVGGGVEGRTHHRGDRPVPVAAG